MTVLTPHRVLLAALVTALLTAAVVAAPATQRGLRPRTPEEQPVRTAFLVAGEAAFSGQRPATCPPLPPRCLLGGAAPAAPDLLLVNLRASSADATGVAQEAVSAGQSALDATPAGVPLPALPGSEAPDPARAPASRPLERDGVLADRFTSPGQRVSYPFRAEAGELSLFELAAAGYARGWAMAAALRVLDPGGRVLAESRRSGGVQLQAFLAFTAPLSEEYTLELLPTEQYFRYALVRHSSYVQRGGPPVDVGQRERVHGWIADASDRALYWVPVRAGEQLALSVEGTRDEARAEHRRLLAEEAGASTMLSLRPVQGGPGRSYAHPPPRFPQLRLELPGDVHPLASSSCFALLAPAAADGFLQVAVSVAAGQPGGLHDLVVRRDVPKVSVGGLVVDADDQPLEGLEVRLLLEPDLEPWGRATTNAQGAWTVLVPPGDYRSELRRLPSGPVQPASVGLRADTELNLLWRGP